MLFNSLWRVGAAVTTALLLPTLAIAADTPKQAAFVSPDGDLAFGFTTPDHGNTDTYFSIRVSTSRSWGAVGLGSDDMFGALFLIIYQNESGNVTFSPRLSYNNYEPEFYDGLKYQLLEGTGVKDGYMTVTALCHNCRSWPSKETNGGVLYVDSPNQKTIYALGPKQKLYNDDPKADLRFHEEFGVFTMDLQRTKKSTGPPSLNDVKASDGATLDMRKAVQWDTRSTFHATFMVMGVIVLLPLGVVFLRVGKWARLHGFNQLIAMIVIMAAVALGIADSFYYRRSWHFNSPHQIIGFVAIGFLIAQFTLGVFHHREHTQGPTKWSRMHIWVGRIALLLAWVNCFIGFNFAMNRITGMAIAGAVIIVLFGALGFVLWQQNAARKRRQAAAFGASEADSYREEPWRREPSANQSPQDGGYEVPGQQIGLKTVSPWKTSQGESKLYEDEPELGGIRTSPKPQGHS